MQKQTETAWKKRKKIRKKREKEEKTDRRQLGSARNQTKVYDRGLHRYPRNSVNDNNVNLFDFFILSIFRNDFKRSISSLPEEWLS